MHQAPVAGRRNYAYVRIKNRGTKVAQNVVVKGFHAPPSTGLVWPDDWQPMTTHQLAAPETWPPTAPPSVTVGPFHWTPGALGHERLLMIASAAGDASNVGNFGPGESIPGWRLVPHDNNIGQRSVHPIAAATPAALVAALPRRAGARGQPGRAGRARRGHRHAAGVPAQAGVEARVREPRRGHVHAAAGCDEAGRADPAGGRARSRPPPCRSCRWPTARS